MNISPHQVSQNEVDSGNRVTVATPGTQIVRPILSRTPITLPASAAGSSAANGKLPVVYLKMQQREQVVPVVSRSGNLISTLSPKISTASSGNVSSTSSINQPCYLTKIPSTQSANVSSLSANQPGFVTIQGPLRPVTQTSGSQPSQPHIITLPKVANTALTLSNQQLLALQSVSGSNQIGSVQQQQYVTIQAPIVSKGQSFGGPNSGQVQPQYVTIRTPVIAPAGSGTGSATQSQFVTIQAPVVQSSGQQSISSAATFLPVTSVGQTSASGKSPVTYQVIKSNVASGDKHIMYPVPVSNIVPSSQSKMIFTPVTIMPKMSVPAGTTSITVQSSSDVIGNTAAISGLKLNASPQFAAKIISSPNTDVGNAATISGIKINANSPYSKIINTSTVSLLQAKSLQTQTIRKEAVILPSFDKTSKSKVKLPMGVSVSNPSSTSPSSHGFINLTIANGHIQQSSPKCVGVMESPRVESEVQVGKDVTLPPEQDQTSAENLSDVESTNIDDLLLPKAGSEKQVTSNSSEVIDIKSILMSRSSNDLDEGMDVDSEETQGEAFHQESQDESEEPNISNTGGTQLGESRVPSSPNLFCEEGDITPSPPNEQPTPKYTITMPDDPDEDIKIQLVNRDESNTSKDVAVRQVDDSSRQPQQKAFKPLLKKSSPKLLSKGNLSSKGQSLLRNPAALPSTPANTTKAGNNKSGVKSILKPKSSKKQDLKKEIPDLSSDGLGDTFNPSGDNKDSLEAPTSPLAPSSFEDFDAIAALEWKDGIGLLPGSNLKFRMNEFGLMEIMSDEEFKSVKAENTNSDSEGLLIDENSNSSIDAKSNSDITKDKKDGVSDDVYCCETCNVYGLASEFLSDRFCTQACSAAFTVKKAWQYRREQDLRALRLRRKKRRLEQQKLVREKAEQDMKDEDIKSESPLMSKLLKKFKSTPSESMSDGDDSMEDPMSVDSHIPLSPTPSLNASDKVGSALSEKDSFNEDCGRKSLKQKSSANFSWSKYLEMVKAKAAPSKLFKDAYPYLKNGFKVGMKLEGIDPEHPASFCVLTVAEVRGYRLRLHFDGYPDNYDFWVNADSREIFQSGWCEKNLRRLTPPKGHTNFNWNAYLKLCKATAAPKFLFSKTSASPVCPNGFRVGMKLEAVDRKNSSLVCVASIADIVDGRCLIHFDSWDDVYDYWADPSSPYIHPVGWCTSHGTTLTPPNQYKDPHMFSWDKYLKETKTSPAPARAFKQRQPSGFRRGMRIEAVDKRVPQLIRVATVDDVRGHTIRIRFDGWPDEYSYWVDDDSPDIHPPGWCLETRHPLEPPLSEEDMKVLSKCGVPGCKGEGHVKGPKYSSHNTAQNCPYAPANLMEDLHLPDRLTCNNDDATLEEWPAVPISDYRKPATNTPKWKRLLQDGNDQEPKRLKMTDDNDVEEKPSLIASMQQKLQSELERSVVDPGYQIETGPGRPTFWAKHSKPLHESPKIRNAVNPQTWTIDEVIELLSSIPCLEEYIKIFREQDIDGEALLMLTQNELVSNMKLKLGHAIRLYNCIVILRQKCM